MHCSENELWQMMRKAMLGCGFRHDIAEDAGWAAVFASHICAEAVVEIADMLEHYASCHSQNLVPFNPSVFRRRGEVLQAELQPWEFLNYGSACCDWLIAHPQTDSVQLKCSSFPYYFTGLLHWTQRQYGGHIILTSPEGETIIRDERICTAPIQGGDITLRYAVDTTASAERSTTDTLQVEERGWERLAHFAQGAYVPETEHSKLFGAGAGLKDND